VRPVGQFARGEGGGDCGGEFRLLRPRLGILAEQRRQAGAGFLGGDREVPGRRRRRAAGSAAGKAASTAGPQLQPAREAASARARVFASPSPPNSCNSARAAVTSATQASAVLRGTTRPSAAASPRGVGTQNRAGRTKANNSSRSSAGNAARPRRRAVARAWQTNAVSPPSRRSRASSGDSASISPSGDSHTTSRKPATSAGACGTITGELSARSRVG
jgi:hypothetical protein